MIEETEIKKISLDVTNLNPAVNVKFTLKTFEDIKKFKKKLTEFGLSLKGQEKLG